MSRVIYRINQFIKSITARITCDDLKFIDKYLNDKEKNMIFKLAKYDLKHSINVARDMENYIEINSLPKEQGNNLIKLGFLHDIGKSNYKLNPIEKSILVIADKISKGDIKKYNKNKKIYIYYNHGEEGYKLLKENKYSKEFLNTIRYHHDKSMDGENLRILRMYDNKN